MFQKGELNVLAISSETAGLSEEIKTLCPNSYIFEVDTALGLSATARQQDESLAQTAASLRTSELDQSSNRGCRVFLGVMDK